MELSPPPQVHGGEAPHLNRELLPLPLGPVTSRLVPEGTRRVKSCTSVAPVGVTTLALSKEISLLAASTVPCACVAPRCADPAIIDNQGVAHVLRSWGLIWDQALVHAIDVANLHASGPWVWLSMLVGWQPSSAPGPEQPQCTDLVCSSSSTGSSWALPSESSGPSCAL